VGERRHASDAGSLRRRAAQAAAEAALRWMSALDPVAAARSVPVPALPSVAGTSRLRPSSVIVGKNGPALRIAGEATKMLSETLVSSKACQFEKPLRA